MELSIQDWHNRYKQQARWTQDLRRYLYDRAELSTARRVLDVGCGTGILLPELIARRLPAGAGSVHGLDLDLQYLTLAARNAPKAHLTHGDGHFMPFAAGSFDLSLCHFLLLWVTDPLQVFVEVKRVTRPGGAILILAEPDYGGRIDHPVELAQLGEWQQSALRQQGADPQIGRRLAQILAQTGLQSVETGVLGGHWTGSPSPQELASEWMVMKADLAGIVSSDELERLQTLDREAYIRGERVLYVPTFYAWGRVPNS